MDIKLKLKKYIEDNLELNKTLYSYAYMEDMDFASNKPILGKYRASKTANINDILDNIDENKKFTNVLFRFIDSKGCKDSDIYNKALIDRRLFSKIRSDINYHPKKETVIQLGLALELNTNELEELLSSAEYSLPKNNEFDLIIRFCFDEHIYNVLDVNNLLEDYNCKLLIKE